MKPRKITLREVVAYEESSSIINIFVCNVVSDSDSIGNGIRGRFQF